MWDNWARFVNGSGKEGDRQGKGTDNKDKRPCTNACIKWRVNAQLQANVQVQSPGKTIKQFNMPLQVHVEKDTGVLS